MKVRRVTPELQHVTPESQYDEKNRYFLAQEYPLKKRYRHYRRCYNAGTALLTIPLMALTGFCFMFLMQSMPLYLTILGTAATVFLATSGMAYLFNRLAKKHGARKEFKTTAQVFKVLAGISGAVTATFGLGFLASVAIVFQPWVLVGGSFASLAAGSMLSIYSNSYYRTRIEPKLDSSRYRMRNDAYLMQFSNPMFGLNESGGQGFLPHHNQQTHSTSETSEERRPGFRLNASSS